MKKGTERKEEMKRQKIGKIGLMDDFPKRNRRFAEKTVYFMKILSDIEVNIYSLSNLCYSYQIGNILQMHLSLMLDLVSFHSS